jgi:hypothetical protein
MKWAREMMARNPRNRQYYAGFLVGLLNVQKMEARDMGHGVDLLDMEIACLSQTRNSGLSKAEAR